MLIAELITEDTLPVHYKEAWEEGLKNIARNALAGGASMEFVQKVTGLGFDALINL